MKHLRRATNNFAIKYLTRPTSGAINLTQGHRFYTAMLNHLVCDSSYAQCVKIFYHEF